MKKYKYLMENKEEAERLVLKTDLASIEKQALWAGIKPGMRVADVGCGPGKITSELHRMVSPDGEAVGIDGSQTRLEYAQKEYGREGIEFFQRNILDPLDDIGTFDFVWIRFVLEYYRSNALELLRNVGRIIKPGGILVLIDLDHNPINHHGFPGRVNTSLDSVLEILKKEHNFDPYAGRKLYSYVYDLGYEDIDVDISINSLVYGELKEIDYFNWMKKVEATQKLINYDFPEYEGGFDAFIEEYERYMHTPRRFSYTPLICCRGRKPLG